MGQPTVQLSDNSRSKSRMNKFTLTFVLLATMAGVSRSQESLLPLPNVVNFTPNFQFSWGYDNTTITIQLEVVTAGWVSVAILKDDGKGFDMWWGGFDEDYGIVYGQDGYASFRSPSRRSAAPLGCDSAGPSSATTTNRTSTSPTTPSSCCCGRTRTATVRRRRPSRPARLS